MSMKKTMIVHASQLVTCQGNLGKFGSDMKEIGILEDGAVLIEGETILAVGTTTQLVESLKGEEVTTFSAEGKILLPGFVDSHTRFVFPEESGNEFSQDFQGNNPYTSLVQGMGQKPTALSLKVADIPTLIGKSKARLDQMLAFGVTTVEGKTGYGLERESELTLLRTMAELNQSHPMDIVATFLGANGILDSWQGRELEYLDEMIAMLPQIRKEGLATYVDILCETGAFTTQQSRTYLKRAKDFGFAVKIHADQMTSQGGAELAVELEAASASHLHHVSKEAIPALAESKTICTLMPMTALKLQQPFPPARSIIDQGGGVALATDYNIGNAQSQGIPLTIALGCFSMSMSVEEVITALTLNGAAALGKADSIGSIQAGKKADILLLNQSNIQSLPYCTGTNLVSKVMKNGEWVMDNT